MLLKIVLSQLRPFPAQLALVVALQLAQTLASLYLPSLNADIIDRGVVTGDIGFIWSTGAWMLAVSALQVLAMVAAVHFSTLVAMGAGRNLRRDIFTRVQGYSSREVGQFGAPSLVTRTTNDVQQVQMLILMGLYMLVSAPVAVVGGIVMALRQDVELSWILAVAMPALIVAVTLIVRRMSPLFRAAQGQLDTVNQVLREQIIGMGVIRAFVKGEHEQRRFAGASGDLAATQTRASQTMALMFPVIMLIVNLSTVAVVWFGAGQIGAGKMQIGALTAYISYIMQILMSVMMAMFVFMMIPRAAVCAERIHEVLATDSSVVEHPSARALPSGPAGVEMRGVGFSYPGAEEPVLRDVGFTAEPGTTTALIGSTGSGKTTVLGLVNRLFDATEGTVLVGGIPVRELTLHSLRTAVGSVPQKAFLFAGTIAGNLRYGNPDASDDELWEALRIAQAEDFVRETPGGLEAPVAQGGKNFSGGQRQRLAIARALVAKPSVYLFDDSFSALDTATDARLRAALRPATREATVIVVGQRISTIRDADQILVLDEGRVVGRGTHTELLEGNTTYQEIVESQMSADEARLTTGHDAGTPAGERGR